MLVFLDFRNHYMDTEIRVCFYFLPLFGLCHYLLIMLLILQPIKRKKEGEEKKMTQEEMLLEAAQTGLDTFLYSIELLSVFICAFSTNYM